MKQPKLKVFGLNEVKPSGWLLNQLKIQAAGLSGNLDKFWPDIMDSAWIGGECEGWERMPYWLDGFIPLAKLLGDADMMARAEKYVNAIIEKQQEDGWLCPTKTPEERRGYDIWALFLILKVLTVWHDATGDERVEDVIRRALRNMDKHIDFAVLFNWAQTRWFECFIPIFWLYEREQDKQWLHDLAIKLRCQGFDWMALYSDFIYKTAQPKGRWSQMNHIVNTAMMLKCPELWRMVSDVPLAIDARGMVDILDKYHGMVTGMFTGDECLAGNSPIQGTELCAVVEYMYSLQHLLSCTGDTFWSDRLELITYNALMATFTPDMWAHQYDQQVNQIECSRQENHIFLTNGPESNLYGLEPNFGCCTANLSQGFPKFAQSIFMGSADGITVTAIAPASVNTTIGGKPVSVCIETDYPFGDSVTIKTSGKFKLSVHIPAWAKSATVNGIASNAGEYYVADVDSDTLTIALNPQIEVVERPNGMVAVKRGALVYSLKLNEKFVQVNQDKPCREFPHCDYEVFTDSHWQYALCADMPMEFAQGSVGDMPYSPDGAPVCIKAYVRKINWDKVDGHAALTPTGEPYGEPEQITLIPYGCTNLRMTELPRA